jgi:voltage-gated potassium channel
MADRRGFRRLARLWARRLEWPLTWLAILFLVLYAFVVLDTGLTRVQHDTIDGVLTLMWAAFGADYLLRLWLAGDKWRFVRTHVLDLLILVLPMARPLRALRVIAVISALNKRLRGGFQGKVAVYIVATTLLVGLTAALAELDAERSAPHATITNFGDAVWWALSTITTVGYGDMYPVTAEGRVIAGTLMVAGITLLGVITGSIATWLVESMRQVGEVAADRAELATERMEVRLAELVGEVRSLTERLSELEREPDRTAAGIEDPAPPG